MPHRSTRPQPRLARSQPLAIGALALLATPASLVDAAAGPASAPPAGVGDAGDGAGAALPAAADAPGHPDDRATLEAALLGFLGR